MARAQIRTFELNVFTTNGFNFLFPSTSKDQVEVRIFPKLFSNFGVFTGPSY